MPRIPASLEASCRTRHAAWLAGLPSAIRERERRWSLSLGHAFDDVSCSWVAPAERVNGERAVLKLGMPHMEGEHEAHGLRFWNGDGVVRVLEVDHTLGAMLLEWCEPGTSLRALPEPDQDIVIARLLRRLWRRPSDDAPFRPLTTMLAHWASETRADADSWPDATLVGAGLQLFEDLPRTSAASVVLATDLHAGNVLRAEREPWLVIDPKPFVGDPAYDATQHLFNCHERMRSDPYGTIRRFADLLAVDDERVRLWTFARAAAEPRADWNAWPIALARAIAP